MSNQPRHSARISAAIRGLRAATFRGSRAPLNSSVGRQKAAGLILGILLVLGVQPVTADGLRLEKGRYRGPVAVFKLTPAQKARILRYRECHLANYRTMNRYTPYVFFLTKQQSQILRRRAGIAPSRFVVYETYRGYNDAGPH